MASSGISPEIEVLHEQTCKNKQDGYIDPDTGYWVFSRFYHEKRGKCCGNLCRHCPYEHVNVKPSRIEKEKRNKGGISISADSNASSPTPKNSMSTYPKSKNSPSKIKLDDSSVKNNRRSFGSCTSLCNNEEERESI